MYEEENPLRISELVTCFKKNLNHSLIEKIFVFFERKKDIYNELYEYIKTVTNKVEIIVIKERPTFRTFFEFANEKLKEKNIIIANTDIYFDKTLNRIKNYDFTNKFFVLTRWNLADDFRLYLQVRKNPFYPWKKINKRKLIKTPDLCNTKSIDTWIFKAPIEINFDCDIKFGVYKCDSLLNYNLLQKAASEPFQIFNPCLSIRACHLDKNVKNKIREEYKEYAKKIYNSEHKEKTKLGSIKWCRLSDTL